MRTRTVLALIGSLIVCHAVAAQEYRVEALAEPAPSEVAEGIAKLLSPTGFKISSDSGRATAEIWLRAELPAKADFEASNTVLYPFTPGELLGVVRFPRRAADFRGQKIASGVYTIRYAQQPEDGNHVGTSETRDFLLMAPAAADTEPAPVEAEALVALSTQASETTHPAMLSLLSAKDAKPTDAPQVMHNEERNLWSVRLAGNAKAGDKAAPVVIDMVFMGQAEG
jgi:hypothetical protein